MKKLIALGVMIACVALALPAFAATENVTWTNLVLATDGGGSTLTKSSAYTTWDAGGSSLRAIASGDGYVEYTVTQAGVYTMAGLSHGDTSTLWQDIDYAMYTHANGLVYAYDDAGKHWLGSYTAGTVLRAEIAGGSIVYKIDGAIVHQHATTPNYPLVLDASVYTPSAAIGEAVISGNLIDAREIFDIFWVNQVNTDDNGGTNTLTKTGVNTTFDAGASSVRAVASGDGYAEFTITQNNVYAMAGLSHGDSSVKWEDIDYAIYACGNGFAYAYDHGGKYWLGPYTAGTTFRVEIEGSNVIYKINGVVKAQHATTPNYPLVMDSSIYSPNGVIGDAKIAGTLIDTRKIQSVVWNNMVNVDDNGGTNTLTKDLGADLSFDAGASSVKAIQSGDGYVEFTCLANDMYFMVGLNDNDTTTFWEEIDYALYLHGNGWAYAYDDLGKHWLGTYNAGDTFRVELLDGNVQYKINGIVMHQHATTPNYPLVADVAIFTPGAVVSNAIISGDLQ